MDEHKGSFNGGTVAKAGISFGSALAMVISYTTWRSVGWAIFHGLLRWVYFIYFMLSYLKKGPRSPERGPCYASLPSSSK